MGAISDLMLGGSCAVLVESLHGETITVLTGSDAGKSFTCVKETESDVIFREELDTDRRAKRVIRFRGPVPSLTSQDRIRTQDGKVWTATIRPDSAYLTVDFEITQFIAVIRPGQSRRQTPVNPPPPNPGGGLLDSNNSPIVGPGLDTVSAVQ